MFKSNRGSLILFCFILYFQSMSAVVVDNYSIWEVRKSSENRLKKNGTWNNGAVFATILSRDLVSMLNRECMDILNEVHSKAPVVEDFMDIEKEEKREDVDNDESPISDAELEALFEEEEEEEKAKPVNKRKRATPSQKFNNRQKAKKEYENQMKRIVKNKKQKTQNTDIPDTVRAWFEHVDDSGKRGYIGLVPEIWKQKYVKGKGFRSIDKVLKTDEGSLVMHYARFVLKKQKQENKQKKMK